MAKTLYGLYDTHNDEICVGIFTAREISELYDTTIDSFYCTVSRKLLLRGRYEVAKFRAKELESESDE